MKDELRLRLRNTTAMNDETYNNKKTIQCCKTRHCT